MSLFWSYRQGMQQEQEFTLMCRIYEFDNLEIDVPKATGPGGQELGSAKWLVNGSITISSNVQKKES